MKKILTRIISSLSLIILICGIIWLLIYIDKVADYTRIKAEFTELEPFPANMPVFFKGFRIGKITKIQPNTDFTATEMNITLFPKNLKFPKNIYVRVKSYNDDWDYVEIELPVIADEKLLESGDKIRGEAKVSLESLMRKHAENGSFDIIIESLSDIMLNINNTVQQADGLLEDVRKTLRSNQNYITLTAKNLAETSDNLSKTTIKIDGSISQKTLDKTMNNIEKTTKNLQQITKNIDCATRNLTETMTNVNEISENIEGITDSVNCTMGKRFAGFRLIFGKPDRNCKCKKLH